MNLELRAYIPSQDWVFYQGNQYLESFLRRVKLFSNTVAQHHYNDDTTYELTVWTTAYDCDGDKLFEKDVIAYDIEGADKREVGQGVILFDAEKFQFVVECDGRDAPVALSTMMHLGSVKKLNSIYETEKDEA